MTNTTPYDLAWKNPEINKRAVELSRAGNQWLTMGDLIAAATMMVLEKGGKIVFPYVWIGKYSYRFDCDPASFLTALQDALEAEDD